MENSEDRFRLDKGTLRREIRYQDGPDVRVTCQCDGTSKAIRQCLHTLDKVDVHSPCYAVLKECALKGSGALDGIAKRGRNLSPQIRQQPNSSGFVPRDTRVYNLVGLSDTLCQTLRVHHICTIEDLLSETGESLQAIKGIGLVDVFRIEAILRLLNYRLAIINREVSGDESSLDLPDEICAALKKRNIFTFERLALETSKSILGIKGIGPAGLKQIEEALKSRDLKLEDTLSPEILALGLSTRTQNLIKNMGMYTREDFLNVRDRSDSEWLRYKNCGRKELKALKRVLVQLGLKGEDVTATLSPDLVALGFSPDVLNFLARSNIHDIKTLVQHSKDDLIRKGLSPKYFRWIPVILSRNGLKLKSE